MTFCFALFYLNLGVPLDIQSLLLPGKLVIHHKIYQHLSRKQINLHKKSLVLQRETLLNELISQRQNVWQYFYGQLMVLKLMCSNHRFPKISCKNADFVFLMKAQVTRKTVNLRKSFFMNYVRSSAGNSMQYLVC